MTVGKFYTILKDRAKSCVISKEEVSNLISITPGIGNLIPRNKGAQYLFDYMEELDLVAQNKTHILLLEGYR